MKRTLWFTLLLFLIVFVNLQCSGKEKSSQVSVSIDPDVPIVITGDFTIGTKTVKSPWFSFQTNITNNSNETVTIMAIELEITAMSTTGGFIINKTTITPSDFSAKFACPAPSETILNLTFTDFGEYLAGESKPLFVQYRGTDVATCAGADTPISPVAIYVGGNPSIDGGATDYSYSVQATVIGWFGGVTSPTDRFSQEIYFTTQ